MKMKGSIRIRNEKYSYYFKYKDSYGKWRTKEKGGFKTKKEAESAMRKAITDYEELNHVATKANYTLEQYVKYWFENVGELSLRYDSLVLYKGVSKNHILPTLGSIKLECLTPSQLQHFFTLKQKKYGKSLIGAIKNVLNGSLNLAVKQKLITVSPMKFVEFATAKSKKKTVKILDKTVLQSIIDKVENTSHFTPALIAIHTGMRRGEILGLVWDDVDFDANTISIDKQLKYQDEQLIHADVKTTSSIRVLQMTKKLRDYLLDLKTINDKNKSFYKEYYYTPHDFVCCEESGEPLKPHAVTLKFCALSDKLGIDFSFHDFRHAHATAMLEAEANILVLQERLGHSDIKTTVNTYSHVTKKLEDQSLEKFNAFF